MDEIRYRMQGDPLRTEPFFPVLAVGTDNGRNRVFINEELAGKNRMVTAFLFVTLSDSRLNGKRDL
jgi:hypothetical protein